MSIVMRGLALDPYGTGGQLVNPETATLVSRSKTIELGSRNKTAALTSRAFSVSLSAETSQKVAALTPRSFTATVVGRKTAT